MDQRIAFLYAAVLYLLLALGNARGDDDRCSFHDHALPLACLVAEGFGLFVRNGGYEVWGILSLVVAGSCALLFRKHTVACLPMAEHLHLLCPTEQEEIAEGCVVCAVDNDMQQSLHELRIEVAEDGSARVVMNIVYHGCLMALMFGGIYGKGETDGVVVVVIEEGALYEGAGGIIGAAFLLTYASNESRRAHLLYVMRDFAAPAGGTGGLETLDNIAKAFIHAILDMDDSMPMVGHADLTKRLYLTAFGGLYGGCFFPFLMNNVACRRMEDAGFGDVVVETAEPWLAFRYHKRDEIDARLIIIMSRIARSI